MNERINSLIEECTEYWTDKGETYFDKEKFATLLKQAMYNDLKAELIENDQIYEMGMGERQYFLGYNSAMVDALCIVQNFGETIEE